MQGEQGRHERAPPQTAGHPPEHDEEQDRVHDVKEEIDGVVAGGTVAEDPVVEHRGEPCERMPVRAVESPEGPFHGLEPQAVPHVGVPNKIEGVIEDEAGAEHVPIRCKRDQDQRRAHEERGISAQAAFGRRCCFLHTGGDPPVHGETLLQYSMIAPKCARCEVERRGSALSEPLDMSAGADYSGRSVGLPAKTTPIRVGQPLDVSAGADYSGGSVGLPAKTTPIRVGQRLDMPRKRLLEENGPGGPRRGGPTDIEIPASHRCATETGRNLVFLPVFRRRS